VNLRTATNGLWDYWNYPGTLTVWGTLVLLAAATSDK